MMRKLTWGVLGFALGAYMMGRTDNRTRRTWMRQARRVGRRVERATERAMNSSSVKSGMKWVNDAIQTLNPR